MSLKTKMYPLADIPTMAECRNFGLTFQPVCCRKYFRAVPTGEKRPPRKGEWYLSGAVVEAYRAPNDLDTLYHIARLVRVETRNVEVVEIIQS